ncbi:MAG: radical SAM protein [Nitrospinae bacterium]|nr:radical SAM protein [Nitrospinota bacterium]
MKVILVRPPDISFGALKNVGGRHHPINSLYLASYLLKDDVEVEIMDLEVEPDAISSLKDKRPDIIGISTMTPTMLTVVRIANVGKEIGAKVILGGAHATIMPEESLRETPADILIRGEGEETLREVVRCLDNHSDLKDVEGISYKTDKGIFHNKPRPYIQDMDSLPIPDRTLLKLDKYSGASSVGISKRSTVLFSSRGCPFNCTFCAAHLTLGRKYRFRSIDSVMEEIESIDRLGFKHITINDDLFTLRKERVMEFCERMHKYPHITFDCDSRVNTIDEEMLRAMKKAGCIKIAYGVESGSPSVLKHMNKGITIEQVIEAFKKTKEVGIITEAFIIVGYMTETKEDFDMSMKLLKKIDPHIMVVSMETPYPGTKLYDLYKEKGYLKEDISWDAFLAFSKKEIPWRSDHFTGKEILKLRNKMLRRFYLNPLYIAKRIMELKNFADFKYYFKSGLSVLKVVSRV